MPELELDLWLKGEDVEPETVITLLDVGAAGTIPGDGKKADTVTFEIGVELPNGDKKTWTMNKTSQRAIAQTFGTNTDLWKDKKIVVFVSEQNVNGTMKKVIYARVPETDSGTPKEEIVG